MSDGLSVFPDDGFFIKGTLSGMDEKIGEYDDVRRVTYRYLIVSGMESFLVSSDIDYRDMLHILDNVTFAVTPRIYGQKIYYAKARFVS